MEDSYADLIEVMEEAPGGENHGRRNGHSLNAEEHRQYDYRFGGGFGIADINTMSTADAGGITYHRGVNHPEEYVDDARVRELVEEEFGFTRTQIESVYSKRGKTPAHQRQLRAAIDARLLALRRSGANMDAFRRVMGLTRSTMDRAVARALSAEAA